LAAGDSIQSSDLQGGRLNNAEALFCPVFSYISKNIALFANSQGAPACPSNKSFIFYEGVSRALAE
jgi:hypothetical protein